MSDEHKTRTNQAESSDNWPLDGVSGGFSEQTFERMKQSQYVVIHDYTGMGSMSELDVFVSFSVSTTPVMDTEEP